MPKKFMDLAAKMSPEAQREARELAMADLAEMELAELRQALQVRQTELAGKLKTTQVAVSRLERRPNLMLNSLSNYIEALGGKLELRAVLPNRTIRLTHLLTTNGKRKNPAVRIAPSARPAPTKNATNGKRKKPAVRKKGTRLAMGRSR